LSLKNAPKKFKNVKDIVFAAVSNFGNSLEFASEELKKDHDIVLKLVKINGNSLKFADESLKSDPEFFIQATYFSLEFDSGGVKNEKEFILKAIKQSGGVIFEYAAKELKSIFKGCYWWHPSGTYWLRCSKHFQFEF
jgi:hypothetical protein